MASSSEDKDQFKVLIAGGSLVGLGLALAFERAGIDFELFEKGDFAPQLGASIGLHPHTIRIFQQLGVWGDIERLVIPLQHRRHYDGNGHCFEDSRVLVEIEEILQRPIIFMERCKALEVLYNHVKNKSKLHARTAVVGYEETSDGIIVMTQNGEQHYGDILIGADGVHSNVRQLMAEKMGMGDENLAKRINEDFTSEYNCIFAVSRNDPENQFLPDAMVHNVYYDDYSAIAAAGEHGLVFWFLFVKSSKFTRTPNCPRFTDEDAWACIQKYGSSLVGPGYTVKDLWDARVKATMVPLEEGVIERWCHCRVVLMGDSVHKATVNPGLGGNLAYEGIARFTNALILLLKERSKPSMSQLTEVFNQYITGQMPRARTVVDISGRITRYEAQSNWALKFAARHIVPWVSDSVKAKLYANFSKAAPWLEYLPLPTTETILEHTHEMPGSIIAPKLIAGTVVLAAAAFLWKTT